MAYERVNDAWPAGSNAGRDLKPTGEEAARAIKLLWRKWMKRPFPYRIKIVSGRTKCWVRGGTFNVNPDEGSFDMGDGARCGGGGWHEVVHSISHLVAYKLHPGTKPHSTQHHFIEREMIEHVVKSGWLDGRLRPKPKPEIDRRSLRASRIEAGIKRWQTKLKRAENALRKLRQQQRRMQRAA